MAGSSLVTGGISMKRPTSSSHHYQEALLASVFIKSIDDKVSGDVVWYICLFFNCTLLL